jgi:hypothetical protein
VTGSDGFWTRDYGNSKAWEPRCLTQRPARHQGDEPDQIRAHIENFGIKNAFKNTRAPNHTWAGANAPVLSPLVVGFE